MISWRKGKPVEPIYPLKNPLSPMGLGPALNGLGSTKGDVPHSPKGRPS